MDGLALVSQKGESVWVVENGVSGVPNFQNGNAVGVHFKIKMFQNVSNII